MSAPVDVLAVMRGAELGYAATGDTGVAKEMAEARAAVAELVEHLRDLSRGMPVSYEDNARVIGNSNALVLEKIRAALAAFSEDAR